MWDCECCGCRAIAASLTRCPTCRKIPKTTHGGPGNAAALPGETGYIAPGVPEQVAENAVDVDAPDAAAAPMVGVPAEPRPAPIEPIPLPTAV
jgi:hypothetical protein